MNVSAPKKVKKSFIKILGKIVLNTILVFVQKPKIENQILVLVSKYKKFWFLMWKHDIERKKFMFSSQKLK